MKVGDKHFPKSDFLRTKRHSFKVLCLCMPNLHAEITKHNDKDLEKNLNKKIQNISAIAETKPNVYWTSYALLKAISKMPLLIISIEIMTYIVLIITAFKNVSIALDTKLQTIVLNLAHTYEL